MKNTHAFMRCLPVETRQQLTGLATTSQMPAIMVVCELVDWAHHKMKALRDAERQAIAKRNASQAVGSEGEAVAVQEEGATT